MSGTQDETGRRHRPRSKGGKVAHQGFGLDFLNISPWRNNGCHGRRNLQQLLGIE
jgi:hypothetical protein